MIRCSYFLSGVEKSWTSIRELVCTWVNEELQMLVQAGLILQSVLHLLMNKATWAKEMHPSLMDEWSRLKDQAIREASSEIGSWSCSDIKYLISSPEHRHEDRFLFSAAKPDTSLHPAMPIPVTQSHLFTGNSIYTPHYTVSIEHEHQTEKRLYTGAEILAPHSVFKLGLKLSSALQLLCSLLLLSGLFHCWCSSCG